MTYNKNYKRLKQLQKILIVLSAFFIVLSFTFNYYMRQNFIKDIHRSLEQETAIISGYINSYYTQYAAITNQLSNNTQVNELVKGIDKNGTADDSSFKRVTGILKDIQATNQPDAFAWIGVNKINSIIYPEGYAVLHDYYYADRPWYKTMVESPEGVSVSEPYIEVSNYNEVITLMRPLYEGDNIIGNIGMDISIVKLREFVASFKLGESGQAFLLTEGEAMISHENTDRVQYLTVDHPLFDIKDDIFIHKSYNMELELNGELVYFYAAPTALESWYLCAYVPKSELSNRINFINLMSVILILSALVIMVVIIVLIRVGSDHKILHEMNNQLIEKEKLLIKKNDEIHTTSARLKIQKNEAEAAYKQLSEVDEELRAQYEEIESYTSELEKLRKQFELAVMYTKSAVWEYDVEKEELSIPFGFEENSANSLNASANSKINIDQMIYVDDRQIFWDALESHIKGDTEALHVQVRVYSPLGELEWWLVHGKGDLSVGNLISGTLVNISKLKEQEAYISQLAYIDPLTELPNRRKFKEKLKTVLASGRKGAVLMLDLDNFKEINDTLGHVYGDRLLKEIARRLKMFASERIFVSRFGGDEFLLIFENMTEITLIQDMVEKVVDLVGQKISIEDNDNEINVSIGITKFPEDSQSVDELIMNADVAMYHVKGNGKDDYVFFNADMRAEIHEKARIEKVLDQALEEGGFRLVLQPKINPKLGRVESGEALLRLKTNELMPNEFIPVAEMSHRILEIGRWVLEEAVKLIHQWQKENRSVKPISVNFSPKQMMDHDFITFYKSLILKYGVDPKYIEFEITESVIVHDEKEIKVFLKEIKSMGSKISLDDFGTGYSSLSYLTYLPVDSIKLDKTLCDRFVDTKDINVIKSLISLAHGLNLSVVAEGIENFMQVELLSRIGCDLIQGYYYSKPLSIEAYETIIDQKFE